MLHRIKCVYSNVLKQKKKIHSYKFLYSAVSTLSLGMIKAFFQRRNSMADLFSQTSSRLLWEWESSSKHNI